MSFVAEMPATATAVAQAAREQTWQVFFHIMTIWRKDPRTLLQFQKVEEEYGKEWMHDVVAPKQKELLRQLLLWTDESWDEIYTEMEKKAAKYRPLPVAVTRFREDLSVGVGDILPTFPVVDLSTNQPYRTSVQELVHGYKTAVVVAGSLT